MKVVNKSDSPVTDAACKKATGKTLKQWFKELDVIDSLKKGRRATAQHVNAEADAWWSTTVAVESEAHHGVTKKDGRKEGCSATFTRVRPDKDLRFIWEHKGCSAPMQVDVQFQNNKGKCLMNVMTSRIQTRAEADGLRNAWSEALVKLKQLCE
jgi:hypothetical protein